MIKKKKKVFIGLSGGVDSSVSAALLQKAGYEVTGVFIRTWSPEWLTCSWREERRDAMRVAAHLGIPFLTFNLEEEYKKEVVDYFLDEYKRGRIPNPDVMCNKEIKFGSFLQTALEMGADYIATGHYAQIKEQHGIFSVEEGMDKGKDQSYFLWTLAQKELAHVLFPVGHLQKSAVRKLAKDFGLPTAVKKDSQGICFLGPVDMKEFLQHYIPIKKGKVVDEKGKEIGNHDGAVFYTIGERHGYTVSSHLASGSPYYVVDKNVASNTITVSHKEDEETLKTIKEITIDNVNWNIPPVEGKEYLIRFRYRQEPQRCLIKNSSKITKIIFKNLQSSVSIGQSAVVYDEKICLGGGIIESTA